MTIPQPPPDERRTALDPGRFPLDQEPVTTLDPGRRPPSDGAVRLPPELADRFTVEETLTGAGQQADVYRVTVRANDEARVLKLYRAGLDLGDRVPVFLTSRGGGHIVTVHEVGSAGDRQFELMEYLPGGTLFSRYLRRRRPVDEPTLTSIVGQLHAGLVELQAAGFVHRDLKPGNVLIRGPEPDPPQVVISDFGITRSVDVERFTTTAHFGTPPYTPPEYLGGQLLPAFDWWSLGVMVVELATGRPLFEHLPDDIIKAHVASRHIPTDDITSARLLLLCRGLVVKDPEHRWGATEVDRWLRGESPGVVDEQPEQDPATEPYYYVGTPFHRRDELAVAMTATWETARGFLFGPDPRPRQALAGWLAQFPELPRPRHPRSGASVNVWLLHQLRTIDRTHPPVYRGENIAVPGLPGLAVNAMGRTGTSAEIVLELWSEDLLPVLAEGSPAPGLAGGDGLAEAHDRWHAEETRLRALVSAIRDDDARAGYVSLIRPDRPYRYSLALLAATADDALRLDVRRELDDLAETAQLPWFTELVARGECLWVAHALRAHVTRAHETEQARLAQEEWLRRTNWLREWSNRENRPQSLARAVSGVVAVAVLLAMLVGVADLAGFATDVAVLDGWFAVVIATAATLTTESLLAWEIGGRYHPRYSLLGAGAITLGRFARSIQGRTPALLSVLAGVAVAGGVAVIAPVVGPLIAVAVVAVGTVSRVRRWRADQAELREIVQRPG